MAENKRESTPNILSDLEDGWDKTVSPSAPDLAELDSGWDEGLDDENDLEDEEPLDEPELPDERQDPAAYLLAKKAQEARAEERRKRKRIKLEAKRERRKTRAASAVQKQKRAKPRSRAARNGSFDADEQAAKGNDAAGASAESDAPRTEDDRQRAGKARRLDGTTGRVSIWKRFSLPIRLAAIALAIVVGVSAFIAAVAK